MDGIVVLLLIGCGLFIYLLPSVLAWNKSQAGGVIAVNLFLGWTFIGWVIALAWACVDDKETQVIVEQVATGDKFDKLTKLKGLLDSGTITPEEFEKEKTKLLQGSLTTEWKLKEENQ